MHNTFTQIGNFFTTHLVAVALGGLILALAAMVGVLVLGRRQ